jgi:hypothetical protein
MLLESSALIHLFVGLRVLDAPQHRVGDPLSGALLKVVPHLAAYRLLALRDFDGVGDVDGAQLHLNETIEDQVAVGCRGSTTAAGARERQR